MSRRSKACAYCGEKATTRDHVPPKGLFARPLPPDLITVPSCASCNCDPSKDDEYFRTIISLRNDTFEHPDATAAAEAVLRSLLRPESAGYRSTIINSIKEVSLVTPSGLYAGQGGWYTADMERIAAVVKRIVKGLHFHHLASRFPEGVRLNVYELEAMIRSGNSVYEKLVPAIEWAQSSELNEVPRKVLVYKFRNLPAEEFGTVWLLRFYEAASFVVIGAPWPAA